MCDIWCSGAALPVCMTCSALQIRHFHPHDPSTLGQATGEP
jgi:hypothetical protein